jgi:hypothetical protein
MEIENNQNKMNHKLPMDIPRAHDVQIYKYYTD